MARTSWSEYGYKDTYAVYNDIHKKMNAAYSKNIAAQDAADAAFLQQFLYNLKNFETVENPDPIMGELNLNYLQLAENATKMMKNGHSISRLFRRQHNYKQKLQNADDIFEQEIDAVIRAFEKMALKETIVVTPGLTKSTLIGQQSANVVNTIKKTTLSEIQKNTISKMNKLKSSEYDGPKARSGKIDIQGGFADIDIQAEVKPEFQKFATLLKDATISAKNYKSLRFDKESKTFTSLEEVSIHLGNTDVFKAFMGGATSLGFSWDVAEKAFFAGYNLFKKNGNEHIAQHIYHIRFLYELTGAGLKDSEGNDLQQVKFLIWNDPTSNNIEVYSTKEIISNLLTQSVIVSNPFTGIYLKTKSH